MGQNRSDMKKRAKKGRGIIWAGWKIKKEKRGGRGKDGFTATAPTQFLHISVLDKRGRRERLMQMFVKEKGGKKAKRRGGEKETIAKPGLGQSESSSRCTDNKRKRDQEGEEGQKEERKKRGRRFPSFGDPKNKGKNSKKEEKKKKKGKAAGDSVCLEFKFTPAPNPWPRKDQKTGGEKKPTIGREKGKKGKGKVRATFSRNRSYLCINFLF